MPAHVWFGRRWRFATDDFTCPGVFLSIFLLVCGILILTRPKDGLSLRECPMSSRAFTDILFAIGIIDTVASLTFLLLAFLSCRGTPFELSKRRLVSVLLYINLFFSVVLLVICVPLAKFAFSDGDYYFCSFFARAVVIYALFANCLVPVGFFIFLFAAFDPYGRRDLALAGDIEYGASSWRRCLKRIRGAHEEETYMDVARALGAVLRIHDLVPSDVMAGMCLLHARHRKECEERYADLSFGEADDKRCERMALQAKPFVKITDVQRGEMRELANYSRFYLAAYGWMLYEFMNCCGSTKLCMFDSKMCCRHHPGVHKGTKCFCDLTMVLKTTGVDDEDVILTSWVNSLFSPVFYVAIDRSTNAVVVAIRGTMSLADCVTDCVSSPHGLEIPENEMTESLGAEAYYAHGGMKRSAENVLSELLINGVMDRLIDGDLSSYKLILLGHSLGAGVATILGIMLWSTKPSLRQRLRCLAYAPPGGLLSPALVEYSKSFVIGCFAGNDMIPRLATHTIEDLRESLFDALALTGLTKSRIFLNLFFNKRYEAHQRSSGNKLYRDLSSQMVSHLTDSRKLYPPHNLLHYCKAVVRAPCKGCLSGRCCGCACEEVFVPAFESPEDVQVIICSPSMFSDHFPDRLFDVIHDTEQRLDAGDLDRFFIYSEGSCQLPLPVSYEGADTVGVSSLI